MLLHAVLLFATSFVSAGASDELPAPKNLMELELDKLNAYHALKSYHEEIQFKFTSSDAAPTTITKSTYIDGTKMHCTIIQPDGSKIEDICDGMKTWAMLPSAKVYMDTAVNLATPFNSVDLLQKCSANNFSYSIDPGKPTTFAIDPYPVLQSDAVVKSGSESLRKIVFVSHLFNGYVMTLTQWFLPDRWLLKRFEYTGADKTHSNTFVGVTTAMDFGSGAPLHEYDCDPALIDGLTAAEQPAPPDYSHPSTFEEFEIAKAAAYHALDEFHEEVDVVTTSSGQATNAHRSYYQSALKFRGESSIGDFHSDDISDGVSHWTIVGGATKKYFESLTNPLLNFDPKEGLPQCGDDSFNFTINPGSPVQFACKPTPALGGVTTVQEGGATLRKVVFTSKSSQGRSITLTEWFQPDKWLVTRFAIEAQGKDGPSSLKGDVKYSNLTEQDKKTEFVLDPALVKGYQKVDDIFKLMSGG